MKYINILWRWS